MGNERSWLNVYDRQIKSIPYTVYDHLTKGSGSVDLENTLNCNLSDSILSISYSRNIR